MTLVGAMFRILLGTVRFVTDVSAISITTVLGSTTALANKITLLSSSW